MNKKYYIRIDDLTPGMKKNILNNIVNFFSELEIKPLIAVIPFSEKEDKDFWDKIKELQEKWWIIWLHWYNHNLRQNPIWIKSIIPIQDYSEFVWLNYEEQKEKIKKWLNILNKYWIKTNIFVAPAHWLDKTTLKVLKEFNFKYVSDWFWLYPKKINWLKFLPQQLWQFRKIHLGYKTICLHLEDFETINNSILNKIKRNKKLFWNFNELLQIATENSYQKLINFLFEKVWFNLLKIKKW